ncbi:MarC family protein [Paraferrimonas haliotis]|uniref:UPF0056 membrane protein n=1 Tax=Paraferrimonas haliotis TaxID=2013866 RepID=A0AA37WX03_9GAMM|nr:MarC family protein [Paraferrimonas haliotis]GLS82894.1 UPF0056 inner membrane protein [Paraferrimonas haliotis]
MIDPIGTVPVFLAVTSQYSQTIRRRIAIKASAVAALVLVFFVVVGEVLLSAMAIPLPAFQVAGGIVLFLFAMTMIFGEGKIEQERKMCEQSTEAAIFPLAIPSIASPGAILAAVMMTENSLYNVTEQFQTLLVILAVLLIAMIFMLLAGRIQTIIGKSGANLISRVMGIILGSVAVANVLEGIKIYFAI